MSQALSATDLPSVVALLRWTWLEGEVIAIVRLLCRQPEGVFGRSALVGSVTLLWF
jgi:hypothetical protein